MKLCWASTNYKASYSWYYCCQLSFHWPILIMVHLYHSCFIILLPLHIFCLRVCFLPSCSVWNHPGILGEGQLAGGLLHRPSSEERCRGRQPGWSNRSGKRGGRLGLRLWHTRSNWKKNLKLFKHLKSGHIDAKVVLRRVTICFEHICCFQSSRWFFLCCCFKLLFIESFALFPLLWDDNLVEHLKVIQHFSFATNFGRIYRCKKWFILDSYCFLIIFFYCFTCQSCAK